jgi:glycolate oxidase
LLQGIVPSALEFMELSAVQIAMQACGLSVKTDSAKAFVLIELDGEELEQLYVQSEKVYEVLEQFGVLEKEFADTAEQKEKLWKIRRSMGEAVKQKSIYKEEDTVVPRYYLPDLYLKIKELEAEYGFESVCYGHAGDGNLHVNIVKGQMSDEDWNTKLNDGITEIFQLCIRLGGTISGEHGIGLVQKPFIKLAFTDVHINLMKDIKKSFDPNYILNPGKIFE